MWETCLEDHDCVVRYDQSPPNEGRFHRLLALSTPHVENCTDATATQMVAWRYHGPQCNPGETWRDGLCVCETDDCDRTPFHNNYIYMCSIAILCFLIVHIGTQIYYSRLVVTTLTSNTKSIGAKSVQNAWKILYPRKTKNTINTKKR